jgi:transposase
MEIFNLKEEDKKYLQSFIRSGAAGHEVIRAVTLLLKHEGQTRAEVASTLDITPKTVTNTCNNYSDFGIERSLKDDPRPGQPTVFDDRVKSKIVALVCSNRYRSKCCGILIFNIRSQK